MSKFFGSGKQGLWPGFASGAAVVVPLVISNAANTSVVDQGGGVYRITKTGGVDGTWDASATSAVGFTADFVIRARAVQTTKDIIVGISTNPTADNSFTSVQRDIRFPVSDVLGAGVSGSSDFGDSVVYTTSDRFFIRRVGTTLTLLKGATDLVTDASVIYTWPSNLAGTVYFDSSLNGASGAIDIYAYAA